ncbi:MAG: M16 family metallopeptidase [Alphaproteobacteria bacterium]
MTIQQSVLPNGLRIVSESMPGLETTSLGIWVGVGARSEKPKQMGVSHMLEHMAFKGTTTRSALDIAEQIEDVGGHLNAYTSREQTAYFARALGDDVPLTLDILGDILQHSTFERDELERERGVIIQEIGEAHDTPDDLVFDLLQEAAYPDQPAGWPILGTPETVSSFSADTLAGYMGDHYGAGSMVLSAAGKIDHDALVALAQDHLTGVPEGTAQVPERAAFSGGCAVEERALEQVHLTLGFPGVAYPDESFYAMQVLSTVLGGGMSSRLFQEVREKRGLAYSVYSFSSSMNDSGLFGIYAGTGPEQVDKLLTVIADQLRAVGDLISKEEFLRARAQLKASTLMALESSSSRTDQMARQLLIYGRIVPLDELVEKLDAVTIEDVKVAARGLLTKAPLAMAAVGPLGDLPSYETVAGRFSA